MYDIALQHDTVPIILTGDLNSDPRAVDGSHLSNFADGNNLVIHVNEPTRITETSATTLDQFISYHFVVAIVLDTIFKIPSLRVRSQKSDFLVPLISLKKYFFIVVFYTI